MFESKSDDSVWLGRTVTPFPENSEMRTVKWEQWNENSEMRTVKWEQWNENSEMRTVKWEQWNENSEMRTVKRKKREGIMKDREETVNGGY